MHRSTALARLTTAAAVVAVLLAACGGDDESAGRKPERNAEPKSNGIADMEPPRALRAAIKAHQKIKNVTYEGRVLEGFSALTLRAADMTLIAAGSNCEVRLATADLGDVTTRTVNGVRYTRGSREAIAELYELPASAGDLLGNRWLSEPAGDEVQCSPVEWVTDDVDIAACLPGPEGEIGGTPTVSVRCVRKGIQYQFHVATTGKPLVMWLDQDGPSGDDLKLVSANSGVRIEKPPPRDIVDTTALQ